jgi:hypothetical protein
MQREFPAIDFATQAEVRSKAEARRSEEITGLLKLFFDRWAAKFDRFERPIFEAVRHSHRPATAGK